MEAAFVVTAVLFLFASSLLWKLALSEDEWTLWSACSVTCGSGNRIRRKIYSHQRKCNENDSQSKHCFVRFCPGYLGWPRIHFTGNLLVDANTVNNFRCSYHKDFYPSEQSGQNIVLKKVSETHVYYERAGENYNPDGTNHVYFVDTNVTSICFGPKRCSLDDPIVGWPVRETTRGVMVAIDVDWQTSSEIYGLGVSVPGIFEGEFQPASYHKVQFGFQGHTNDNSPDMARYKSKLKNVTWYDSYYESLFGSAKELSISFTIDSYSESTLMGRISGTFGITSDDDPTMISAGRIFQLGALTASKKLDSAPFYLDKESKVLSADLSMSFSRDPSGIIMSGELGQLDVAMLPRARPNDEWTLWTMITTGGQVSNSIGSSDDWYRIFGGIVDIDLSEISPFTMKLMLKSRIGIINEKGVIYLAEYPFGINYNLINSAVTRLDVGEAFHNHVFVSSYGKPVRNAQVNLYPIVGELANNICFLQSCNRSLGTPSSAVSFSTDSHMVLTNRSGIAPVRIYAMSDPGNVRGCGIDGQIYPFKIFIRYRIGNQTWTYSEGPKLSHGKVQYSARYETNRFSTVVRIFSVTPTKPCPVWNDVKGIFLQYYNQYPVMWKYGIIDLHSYGEIRKRSRMLYDAMFNTEFTSARYMPTSRELSAGKHLLIKNWIKCGMQKISSYTVDQQCSDSTLKEGVEEVRSLLRHAVMLHLSTIPIYMTAWFSLKTEFGRNQEIADVLQTVFVEKMLHMTLAVNVLNAVGGSVQLIDVNALPAFPKILATGPGYQLLPDVQVALEPFSIGSVDQIFSGIEKPPGRKTQQVINKLGSIWNLLYAKNTSSVSKKMRKSIRESDTNDTHFTLYLYGRQLKDWFPSSQEYWSSLLENANDIIDVMTVTDTKSVGGLYSLISLKLIALESCAKIRNLNNPQRNESTIFQGNKWYQLNMSHWYHKRRDSTLNIKKVDDAFHTSASAFATKKGIENTFTPSLFEVTDLKSALEAILEVIYQGESGSEYFPIGTQTDTYGSLWGQDDGYELSHYYRLREIVHGRRLIKSSTSYVPNHICFNKSTLYSCSTLPNQLHCYSGDAIPFYSDGVWPMLSNPKETDYVKGSEVHLLNNQFNLLYTRLLFCLEGAFSGKPNSLEECMSIMHDLTIAGKRLVRTPVLNQDGTKSAYTGTPTWQLIRERWNRAGLSLTDL